MSDPFVGQAVGAGMMISHLGGAPNFDYSGPVNAFTAAATGITLGPSPQATASPAPSLKHGLAQAM